MAISLRGTVTTQGGAPIENAAVRLIGLGEPLGGVSSAAVHHPGAVTWTRLISGYHGNRWNCWQKFVMNQVAGITWDEFSVQVIEQNPALRDDGFVFRPEKTYRLPAQTADHPRVAWTRPLTGFHGNRWQCWTQYVQGKVEGVTWNEFMYGAMAHNPSLREDDNVFQADKVYVLPENIPGPDEVAWTRQLTGFFGNRWQCWEAHVRDQVQGITWIEFMSEVLVRNPILHSDAYVFQADKTYVLPENPPRPIYYLSALTGSAGQYAFEYLPAPGECELSVEAGGYHPHHVRLDLSGDEVRDVTLVGTTAVMVSDWEGYATASQAVRRLIDQALAMLGDDPVVYDSLPDELKPLVTGYYHRDPNHPQHKDIVCADLVTVCLHVAGVDYGWEVTEPHGTPFVDTFAANYYRPRPDHPKLHVVPDLAEWRPGDMLIYWNGSMASNALRHINLYVGPFSGTDLSGTEHPPARGYDVVNASFDWFDAAGREVGTAVRPMTSQACMAHRCGYEHVMRVRHVDL